MSPPGGEKHKPGSRKERGELILSGRKKNLDPEAKRREKGVKEERRSLARKDTL